VNKVDKIEFDEIVNDQGEDAIQVYLYVIGEEDYINLASAHDYTEAMEYATKFVLELNKQGDDD